MKGSYLGEFEELVMMTCLYLKEEAYGINEPTQIEVHDLVRVLRAAKDDKRIKGLVLDLGAMGASPSSASTIAGRTSVRSAPRTASASTTWPSAAASASSAAPSGPLAPKRRSKSAHARSGSVENVL